MEIVNLKTQSKTKQITTIRQAVKNPNRVNVFLNEKFAFSLDITQCTNFKLKVGQKLNAKKIQEYQRASETGKLYQKTLKWILMRPRSIKETRDYLYGKQKVEITEQDIEMIIKKLEKKKYLNDWEFAKYYVENRFIKKGISTRRLENELQKKGVEGEIISQILKLDMRDDAQEIQKIIRKKRTKYNDEKLISYLVRQGFDFEMVQNLVQSYEKD